MDKILQPGVLDVWQWESWAILARMAHNLRRAEAATPAVFAHHGEAGVSAHAEFLASAHRDLGRLVQQVGEAA